jgi:hypothetical protein
MTDERVRPTEPARLDPTNISARRIPLDAAAHATGGGDDRAVWSRVLARSGE